MMSEEQFRKVKKLKELKELKELRKVPIAMTTRPRRAI